MKSKDIIIGVLVLVVVIGIIFIINPFKQGEETEGESQLGGEGETEGVKTFQFDEKDGKLEADVKYTSEGLLISGEFTDTEVFQLPDGSYAIDLGGLGKVAYSPDGLTWTISEDSVIGEAPSILKLPDGGTGHGGLFLRVMKLLICLLLFPVMDIIGGKQRC